MLCLFSKGRQWPEQPSLPKSVQTRPAKPSLQQASVFPVHPAGGCHVIPAFLHSLRSFPSHGERRRLLLFRPTGVRRHHSNILGHCCKCSGETVNITKYCQNRTAKWKEDLIFIIMVWCTSAPRSDSTRTTGLPSITSSYGGAWWCTLPYYLQCRATAYLAFFRAASHLSVSLVQCGPRKKITLIRENCISFYSSSGTARNCLSEKSVWLVVLLTTVVCVMPGLVVKFLRVDLFPTLTDKVQQLQVTQNTLLRHCR